MIGISVGLGNVWRFPYMMGEYGGSAFLLVYLIFTFVFAIPAVMAEWTLGRSTRQGPIGAFGAMWGKKAGKIIGGILLINITVAVAYYVYVIGNIGFSTVFGLVTGFNEQQKNLYQELLSHRGLQYAMSLLLIIGCYLVLAKGLKRGIAALCRLFVPFFVVVIFLLIIFALQLKGASSGLVNFLKPDFSQMNAQNIFAALGQAFFSLGLGGTFLVVFGSYMRAGDNLKNTAIFTALGDVSAAVLAGLFIVPTVLALGLVLDQGPSLLFSTLPELFSRMVYGQWLGSLFLFALFMVTFISALAALEVILTGLDDALKSRLSRKKILLYLSLVQVIIVSFIAYQPSIIGTLDLIFGSGMQVFGSGISLLALTWGLGKRKTIMAVFNLSTKQFEQKTVKRNLQSFYYYWIKWGIPIALFSVLFGYIYSKL